MDRGYIPSTDVEEQRDARLKPCRAGIVLANIWLVGWLILVSYLQSCRLYELS
jgi:hypothetical protein